MRARLLALLLLLTPALCHSQYKPWYHMFNFAYGAKARSMGNAFTAVADDLTAAFWNPAGLLTGRGPEFYLGYKSTAQYHDYELQDRRVARDTRLYNYNFAARLSQIDFFAISAPFMALQRPCVFALSYYRYIPYGFKGTTREVETSLSDRFEPWRTTTNFSGSEGFDVLSFSLAAAVVGPFTMGATLQQFFGSGSLHFKRESQDGESHSELTESVRGRNVILGALFAPCHWLRLGATWHSGLESRFDSSRLTWDAGFQGGKSGEEQASSQAHVVIPEQVAVGLLLQPMPWLDLSADYSIIEWDKATIDDYYGFPVLPYPQKSDWTRAQKPVRNLRFGAEARLPIRSRTLFLRGGWSRDSQLYVDTSGVAVKLFGLAVGAGWEFSRYMLLEIAFQRQKADFTEEGYFGYKAEVPTHFRSSAFFLALTYRFGHVFRE